jgi:hypothetical protein
LSCVKNALNDDWDWLLCVNSDDEEVYHTPRDQPCEDEDDKVFELKEHSSPGPSMLELERQRILREMMETSLRIEKLKSINWD